MKKETETENRPHVITIDPGDNTAIVYWGTGEKPIVDLFFALNSNMKKMPETVRHNLITTWASDTFNSILKITKDNDVMLIIEGVSLWGNSSKSTTAALRGDSFRLAYIVGGILTQFQNTFVLGKAEVVDVRTWKGSLPTPILIKEVERYTGSPPKNEHIACAIGIGMHLFGRL